MEFFQIFKRFSGETMLELVFCGKNARLSREKCCKSARNFTFWCKFSVIYDKKLAAAAKKSLDFQRKNGIIADGKAELFLKAIKKDPTEVESKLPLLQLYSLERK